MVRFLTKGLRIHHLYLIVALIWGTIQVFLMPPFQVPDEPAHFLKSWGVAQGYVRAPDMRIPVPANVIKMLTECDPEKVRQGLCHVDKVLAFLQVKIASPDREVFCHVSAYNPLGYFPQALGLKLAQLFDLSLLHAFFLGRFFNLLAGIFLISAAIKFSPLGKEIFFFTGLLPMTIHQLASFSNDALTISGLMFFNSQILFYAQHQKLDNLKIIYLVLISLIFVQMKPGYIALLLLFLVFSSRQFSHIKQYALFLFLLLSLNFLEFFLLTHLVDLKYFIKLMPQINPHQQLAFILAHPLDYLAIFWNTILSNPPPWLALCEMLGILGSLSILFPKSYYAFIIFSFFIMLSLSSVQACLTPTQRIILFFTFILTVLYIDTILYIFWTKPMAPLIEGFQGRYLIGVFPLLVLSMYRPGINKAIIGFILFAIMFIIIRQSSLKLMVLTLLAALFIMAINYEREKIGKIYKALTAIVLCSTIATITLRYIYIYYFEYYNCWQ
jgi:uncharacterized membrane protein